MCAVTLGEVLTGVGVLEGDREGEGGCGCQGIDLLRVYAPTRPCFLALQQLAAR